MPAPRLRKYLSAPGLLSRVRQAFDKIADHRQRACHYALSDVLMSALAMFGLKYPSLLKFDEGRNEKLVRHNLKTLYGVAQAPCDTQMREILDAVPAARLRGAFQAVHQQLRRDKVLAAYEFLDGRYVLSLDGTGQFVSDTVSCPECCVKHRQGGESYYHQLLAGVLVHPQRQAVLPVLAEPILRGDGESKNDCERSAAKRLLRTIKAEHPRLPLIVVEDSLASNGPHLKLLMELDYRYIIGVKEGDHAVLFEAVQERLKAGAVEEFEYTDQQGVLHGFRFLNDLPLNKTHAEIRVNYLDYWEVKDGKETNFTWVTDITLTRDSVIAVMRGGRARWKIENETFNTLKNQGYRFEHNYGHGKQHLASVLALLMLLAFLIDQVQEWSCSLFQAARQRYRSRTSLWEKLRALFDNYYIPSWEILWRSIAERHKGALLQPDTS